MTDFSTQYQRLNEEQRRAVDLIDGPLLVLAGPGTGKTQLLSARVANILQKTDTLPQNIVCLTFTENAAHNMRERLIGMIGEAAYDVHIATYHSFGSDIIRSYPDYFDTIDLETGEDTRLERPIDDLTKIQILSELVGKLPYDDPLRSAQYFIGSVDSTISDLKKSDTSPDQLRHIADENLRAVSALSPRINEALSGRAGSRKFDEKFSAFDALVPVLKTSDTQLANQALDKLEKALAEAESTRKTNAITAWKNDWLHIDEMGSFTFTKIDQHRKLISLARIYEQYQAKLKERSLYDFDDMILRTNEALEHNDELRYNVQEQYQYILLDEFQDTNAAQFKMVHLIANHPVHEGRPNIMAVGDDDQAIYAFQGAEVSNMIAFTKTYRDTNVINLKKNYRSHHDIIHIAHNIGEQIESRLHHELNNVEKTLEAAQTNLPDSATIERHEFKAQASEYIWVANKIKQLVGSGVKPEEIAVLSPKHALLEEIVPCLNDQKIPVTYEKRENILTTPIVQQLEHMALLVDAISRQDNAFMNQLFPQVLSLGFWNNSVENIWRINWKFAPKPEKRTWAEIALEDESLKDQVLFLLSLGSQATTMPLEYILDILMGTTPLQLSDETSYTSPFKQYYFDASKQDTLVYYEAISHLSVIRSHLRAYQQDETDLLTLTHFLTFFQMYRDAGKPLINSHPIAQDVSSVQLMTVYKAKGLEFEYVFLLSMQDTIWGKTSRSQSNKIGLPANLTHIRYQGSSEDELRRLLFVAITRAKHGLFLTSFAFSDTGKQMRAVKYLLEQQNEDGQKRVGILPSGSQEVITTQVKGEKAYQHTELLWQQRHIDFATTLQNLLAPRLKKYQMSPTHVNSFIDLEYGGPQEFVLQTLLRFPAAPTPEGEYGNAIHTTLEWYQNETQKPSIKTALEYYTKNLEKFYIPPDKRDELQARGRKSLQMYLEARSDMFSRTAKSEVDFRKEGVVLGEAHLSGKIDRIEINKQDKTLAIIDYKTGKPHSKWDREVKLLKYEQQLYFYTLLIEKSHTYQGYKVSEARLEFIEPNMSGTIVQPLVLQFNDKKYQDFKKLIEVVWHNIQTLNLPDISNYKADYAGTQQFIKNLISDEAPGDVN